MNPPIRMVGFCWLSVTSKAGGGVIKKSHCTRQNSTKEPCVVSMLPFTNQLASKKAPMCALLPRAIDIPHQSGC